MSVFLLLRVLDVLMCVSAVDVIFSCSLSRCSSVITRVRAFCLFLSGVHLVVLVVCRIALATILGVRVISACS